MRKILLFMLVVCFVLSLTITCYAVSGRGTQANPFRITNEEELLLLVDFPECYFELENDIEVTATWEPVADFSGSLDGKGHTITVSDYMPKVNMGFFGTLTGTVKNLTINANSISVSRDLVTYIGLFAGKCTGTIENSKVTGRFSFKRQQQYNDTASFYMGGFCGELSGSIKNSIARLDLLETQGYGSSWKMMYTGGICGKLTGAVEQCANMSNIYAFYASYGGIAYSLSSDSALIKNSMNLETSFGGNSNYSCYAGIAQYNSGKIENCYSVGGNHKFEYSNYGIAPSGTMINCFYNKETNNNSSTSYGTPKSTLAMKMEVTYKDWDFENVWAIDESEENPINDGYPYLKAFYEDVESPVTLSSVSAVNGNIVIDTKITDTSNDYTLHIALYDSRNILCDYLVIPNERGLKDVFVVYPDNKNATYAKIFTWYSTDSVIPVSTCEVITIER